MKNSKLSYKTRLMNFVEFLGRQVSWTELHEFIITEHIAEGKIDYDNYWNNPRYYRGYFCSAFNLTQGYYDKRPIGYMMKPSKREPRYLVKINNMYEVTC